MVSYLELLLMFYIAISFVLVFRIQKNIFPGNYFSNSQVVLNRDVTYKMFLLRYFFIFTFGLFNYLIFNKIKIILMGTFLGSFLIIWPTLLSPSEAYNLIYIKIKDIIYIYILNFIFVVSSILIVYLSIIIFPLVRSLLFDRGDEVLYDLLKWIIYPSIGISIERKLAILVNRKILSDQEILEKENYNNSDSEYYKIE